MVLSAVYSSSFFLILGIPGLIIGIISLVDVFLHPTWAWEQSGQNKTLWIVLTIVGLFVCPLIIGLVYLIAIRPKVAAAQKGGGPTGGGGYGGGAPYGGTGQYGAGPGQYGGAGQYGAGPGQYGPGQYGAAPGQYGGPTGQYGGPTGQYGDSPGPGAGPGSGQYGTAPTQPPTPPPGPAPASPPPGWYPDPAGSGQPRYWNGQSWA